MRRITSISIIIFLAATTLNAQKLLLNQDYLNQFPAIERVRTAEKGSDDVGNAFKVHDLDWALPGLHVEYRVINGDENGRVEINGTGYVRIETATAYSTRTADEKKKKADRKVL